MVVQKWRLSYQTSCPRPAVKGVARICAHLGDTPKGGKGSGRRDRWGLEFKEVWFQIGASVLHSEGLIDITLYRYSKIACAQGSYNNDRCAQGLVE